MDIGQTDIPEKEVFINRRDCVRTETSFQIEGIYVTRERWERHMKSQANKKDK